MKQNSNPHKFEPISQYSKLCKLCLKPKLDELHLENLGPEDFTNVKPPAEVPRSPEIVYEKPPNNSIENRIKSAAPETNQPDCYGHTCPVCNVRWSHDYKCWPGTQESLACPMHFGTVMSEIKRLDDITELIKPSENEAAFLASQRIEHESFVKLQVNKLSYDEFEQWCAAHIRSLRALIEQYNNKIYATRSVVAGRRRLEESKLTPEERDDYLRKAKRQKKIDLDAAKTKAKQSWDEQKKSLLKAVGNNEDKAIEILKNVYKSQGLNLPEGI